MAQLSDDCFAFGGPMMSVDEAVGLIATRVTPVVDVETVSLARADGRILAHDILAPLPLPPFTNSAVDGYAVSSRDLPQKEEQAFPVTGRVQAGGSSNAPVMPGQAMRIFTGAPMPDGADTVFMQEDVRVDGDKVASRGPKPGATAYPREDVQIGLCGAEGRQRLVRGCRAAAAARTPPMQSGALRRGVLHCKRLASPERRAPRPDSEPQTAFEVRCASRLGWRSLSPASSGMTAELARALQEGLVRDLILTPAAFRWQEEDHAGRECQSGVTVLRRMAKPGRPSRWESSTAPIHRFAGHPWRVSSPHSRGVADHFDLVRAGAAAADAGSRRLQLQEEDCPPRICPRHPAQGCGWRARSDKISARGRRASVVAGRYRWPGRTRRTGDGG
jgi:molybdopterin molybdotransferase